MSGFGFTEEQEMLRQEVTRFAQRELAPGAKERSQMHPAYSTEHPISQRLRDVLGFQLGDGPPQIQKMIIAKLMIGKAVVG